MGTIRYIGIVITVLAIVLAPASVTRGTINFITLTLVNPGDNPTSLSNGSGYYLAGKTYSFQINVVDPDITGWAQLTDVRIIIPNTTNIVVSLNPSGTGVGLPVTVVSGAVNAVATVTGDYNNCTVIFEITFRWDTPESVWASRTMTASATSTNTRTTDRIVSYGVCSTVKIINFAQNGVAADAMVNPWHDAFNVTGAVIYNVPGATIADRLNTVDPGEITNTTLYIDGNATGFSDAVMADDLSYTVTAQYIDLNLVTKLGNHSWSVQCSMATAGASEGSANTLVLNCDQVQVTAIAFLNGGGVDAPNYYRSVNVPGTQVRVTARMQNGGGNVVGNTTVTVRNVTEGPAGDITVLIANGQGSGIGDVTNPTTVNGTTEVDTYRIQTVTGGAHGGDTAPNGQSDETRITQPANPVIYWDDDDPPGPDSAPFTTGSSPSPTAYSLTFSWQALTTAGPDFDGDFYTYRLYYKEQASPVWLIVDRNTAGYAALGAIGAGTVTATIPDLRPITNYDYYITAIDVFGNEVDVLNYFPSSPSGTAATIASTVEVSITDGIDSFDNSSFDNPAASARLLRKTAIRVSMFIVGAGDLPDSVNVIAAKDGATDIVAAGAGVINGALKENTDYFRLSSIKTGPNQWNAYIPDTNTTLINVGTDVRFILELVKGGVPTYLDHDSEFEAAPGDPSNHEWTFRINSAPTFTPWPTRVLNNVLTEENPICYPSYYLTDDAYVSIKAYDIKGRPIATLLDNVYRKGGQNIKEGGWRGNNRSNKKLGVGLYYLHFKATRASDGQVILNSFKKVVMAR